MLLISNTVLETADGRSFPSRAFRWGGSPIVDVCTVDAWYGHLLVLTEDGALHGVDLNAADSARLCTAPLPVMTQEEGGRGFGRQRYRLHACADGRFAAVVVDQGRSGVVVEVEGGRCTMRLDGGDYHEQTVPFSACFLRFEERTVFVHRTAWNRLDASDPATGRNLTERSIAPDELVDQTSRHVLDYFHGQLLPSPDGSHIYDDGWVWHPVSIPRIWSVTQWLAANPWEGEDGASVVELAMREDWSLPACWVDERRIAMWGCSGWYEEAGEEVERGAGVRVFDVAGPEPALSAWLPMDGALDVCDLFSDGRHLFVARDGGTAVWDIASRAQVAQLPGFAARLLHRSRGALVHFGPDEICDVALTR